VIAKESEQKRYHRGSGIMKMITLRRVSRVWTKKTVKRVSTKFFYQAG